MVAVIPQNGPKLNISTGNAILSKRTSNPSFAEHMKRGAAQTTRAFAHGAGVMSGAVPGAAILSSTLSQTANKMDAANKRGVGMNPSFGSGSKLGNLLNGPASNNSGDGAGGSEGQGLAATMEDLQDKMMSNNMYMLGVQREFQQMSEYFTTVSNLLRVKHDTEKNSISNIR